MLNFSKEQLDALSEMLCQNIETVLEKLSLSLRRDSKKYCGCCPVHDGDNITALNLYHDGYGRQLGNWICNTHHCEKTFNSTIIGFIRGVLSEKAGWKGGKEKMTTFPDTLKWCLNTLGKKPNEIIVDQQNIERNKFISLANIVGNAEKAERTKWTKEEFVSRIDLNNEYFVNRGFSKAILQKFNVGLSKTDNHLSLAYNRVIAPIYDEDGKFVVGGQGRSLCKECSTCGLYHAESISCPDSYLQYAKWVNIPEKFEISRHLYNYWNAKKPIISKNYAILVEGPPDVWKLEEAGYDTSLAICGSSVSDSQQILLEMTGVNKVYTLFDSDPAGKTCAESTYNKLKRQFKVINIETEGFKDVGEMKVDEIKSLLGGYIKC